MRIFAGLLIVFGFLGLAQAQPEQWRAEGWKTDFSKMSVDADEVLSGGPPKDGIPPIDEPKFLDVSGATHLADREPVIGLTIKGDARAYPLSVMTWHEIVNDVVGGKPVTVTYCPLCNAAIVFDAMLDGEHLTFGTTGKLRKSDLIMYDRKTESWWQQFVGEAIAGKYLGKKLSLIPARLESWAEFKARNPQGKVLVPNDIRLRDYGSNPYTGYDTAERPFLYKGSMPEGISPMARVVVVRRTNKEPLIVSMAHVRDKSLLEIDGLRIGWKSGQASALSEAEIAKGRDVGSITVVQSDTASDVAYDVTFAFVAHAFHPEVAIRQK